MRAGYDLERLADRVAQSSGYFETFLDTGSLAAGILVLRPGEKDTQGPHGSDEVYYVVRGDGFLRIRNKDHRVAAGMAFFVGKGVEHYFHGNESELRVVYFFGGPDP